MCGIIGYIGNKNSIPTLIKGLKLLEYRGYDSAGICTIQNQRLKNLKVMGRITDLEKKPELKNLQGNIGIGHTRWATHGEPSEINAHPHIDCKGEIAIVHNGIIENYQALKNILEKEGHKIVSATDSEIIAHLIEKFYQGDLEKAVMRALKLLEGAFGLAIIHAKEPKIVVARKGSPLIIGKGADEMFVASDAAAILDQTRKVVYLQDNELATVTANSFSVKNLDGKEIEKEIEEIKWTADQIEKKGFKHFMLKEIFEQPQAVENTLRGRIKEKEIKLSLNLDPKSIKRIILIACGTSWHACLVGKHIIEKLAKIPVEVDYASEFRYRNPLVASQDLLITISQSGETADTLGALKEAKLKGVKTLGIVNVVGSTVSREVDSGIFLHAGPEIGVASTKAFTCQLTALTLLALYFQQEKGVGIGKEILEELKNISKKIQLILKEADKIKTVAKGFSGNKNFLYLGRGINFPVALEGALKLKEISYIHAEGYPAAEMKHGPIALIDKDMPVVFIATRDQTYDKILSNIEEVKARKGRIITVISKEDSKIEELSDFIIKIPETNELLSPILNVVPLQLLAYYIADLKNIDPDRPRNLAKSVTVE